jgi:hypothetical protein
MTCERGECARSDAASYSNKRLAADDAPRLGGFHAFALRGFRLRLAAPADQREHTEDGGHD